MSPNELLISDDRYKYYIAQLLELKRMSYCSLSQISELLGLSSYKAENYLKELIEDLRKFDQGTVIEVSDNGEIHSTTLSHLLVKKLRLQYLEKSPTYQMFHHFITLEISLDNQLVQERIILSRAGAYKYQKNIKSLLKEEGFVLKKNQLLGSEFQLRSFIYGTYYELFNGIGNPFEKRIRQMAKEIISHFIYYFEKSLTKTQEIKLLFFLCVWLTRLNFQHVIDEVYIELEQESFASYLQKILREHFNLKDSEIQLEIAYFFLFIYLEGFENSLKLYFKVSDTEKQACSITSTFFDLLTTQVETDGESLQVPEQLTEEFQNINRKWLIYHFKESTFITKGQIRYFQEINPMLDDFIRNFIENLEWQSLFFSQQEKTKLYYDYLFFIITKFPIEKLETPLHICIDFSHGANYNEYICRMLSSLQSMNIYYEAKLSTRTQLYLSDFALDALPCQQLIWKRPPTPEDWRELGDLLVAIKGGIK